MATLTVKIDTHSLNANIVRETEIIQAYLERIAKRVVQRLAEEVAQPVAQSNFGFDGLVNVYTEKTPNGYAIVAEGEQVCFLEFGAGVTTDTTHPFAGKVPFMVTAGSWSQSPQGMKQYVPNTHEYWYYHGEKYTGVEPRRGMYEAYKAVLQSVEMVLRDELDK